MEKGLVILCLIFVVLLVSGVVGVLLYYAKDRGAWLRAVLAGLGAAILAVGLICSVDEMVREMHPSYTEIGWGAGLLVFALCMPIGKKKTEGKE